MLETIILAILVIVPLTLAISAIWLLSAIVGRTLRLIGGLFRLSDRH